ncbi:hypothetical protein [Flavobacterium sp.]|uniref:hypothetical protein n=1 Tax=Flavobacterium sp. TaxID=239 RepID=UPI0037C073FF
MEVYYLIHNCDETKFRLFLNQSNSDICKKFNEINKNTKLFRKFILVIEAVKTKVHNKTQFNWEMSFDCGEVYAIKIDNHRFYTLVVVNSGYRELYMSRYGKKESQENTKKLISTISSIENISIQKALL